MRALAALFLFFVPGTRVLDISPSASTGPVANVPGDIAIGHGLILGINNAPAPQGALHSFGLDGKTRQIVDGLESPAGVDIKGDLAVVTERNQLRVFRIDAASGQLADAGAIPVSEGATGLGLYRRPRDGALFAIVSHKFRQAAGTFLAEYRLTDDGAHVTGKKVRDFGKFPGGAVAIDDTEGHVYYSEATCCVHKYYADPDRSDAALEVARHATDKYDGRREGIAITPGWLIVADRIAGQSQYHVYAKRGAALRPLFSLRGPADSATGIEFSATQPGFPDGLLVTANAAGKNFLLFGLKSRY